MQLCMPCMEWEEKFAREGRFSFFARSIRFACSDWTVDDRDHWKLEEPANAAVIGGPKFNIAMHSYCSPNSFCCRFSGELSWEWVIPLLDDRAMCVGQLLCAGSGLGDTHLRHSRAKWSFVLISDSKTHMI